ncbi:MAG: hypothetical protein GXY34_11990 [Syntrophomonadaceae bacterium]|nr:hypothetical protein [Syntrophomonadaceae bacterium]
MIIARMTAFVLFFMSLGLSAYGQNIFPECRFHFGTDWEKARSNSALMGQVDYLTGPWIGTSETFNIGEYYELCRDNNKVPVNHTYIIAFAARRDRGLQDCNVDQNNNLCKGGAKYIRENRTKILNIYGNFAKGVNNIMGSRPSVWLMEADFTQYTLETQDGGGLSYQEAGQLMKDMISTIKTNCPSAYFSIDISPWRDTTWQKNWYGALGMDQFSFIHTSGGSSRGDTEFISDSWSPSLPKWAWTYKAFGKPVFADAGYGVGGAGTGHDVRWDDINNLRKRVNDGVIGLAQVNPASNWANTITSLRSQLPKPPSCTGNDDPCTPSSITPHIQINNGTWQQISQATANVGSTVKFGPHPSSGGSWSWSGPGGFSASTREVELTNVRMDQGGDYVATYTNAQGCKSTQKLSLTVEPAVSVKVNREKAEFGVFIKDNVLRAVGGAGSNFMLSVYTLRGEIVYRKSFSGTVALPLASDLIGGSYLIEVKRGRDVVLKSRVMLAD